MKITLCSSGAYVTCIYCGLSVKISMHKMLHGAQKSWTHWFCVRNRPKPEDPMQLEHHGWRCHYIGQQYKRPSSPLYICGLDLDIFWPNSHNINKHWGKSILQVPDTGTSQYWWILEHFWCTSIVWKCDIYVL